MRTSGRWPSLRGVIVKLREEGYSMGDVGRGTRDEPAGRLRPASPLSKALVMDRPGVMLGFALLTAECGASDSLGPSASRDPDQAAIETCREAARASFRVVDALTVQLENRVTGDRETPREVNRSVREATVSIKRCDEFSSVEDAQVQACFRAAGNGLKAAEAIAGALSSSSAEAQDSYTMAAEFYLDQHAEDLAECGV
jgi:hypothetical protein